MKISELMRPIGEFPLISTEAIFMDGVVALENYPMDIVQGLEPKYDDMVHFSSRMGKILLV